MQRKSILSWWQLLPVLLLSLVSPAFANTFVVTSNGDSHATNFSTGQDATGQVTLRSALEAANTQSGAHTITFAASANGTINLTLGAIWVGDMLYGAKGFTILGNGQGNTIVRQTTAARIFRTDIGDISLWITNMSLVYAGPPTPYGGGGGAIDAGGPGAVTRIDDCTFTGFNMQENNGGAVSASWAGVHSLTINNSRFENNRAGGGGGALFFASQGGTANITDCIFVNNGTEPKGLNSGGPGGAIYIGGISPGTVSNITRCVFMSNIVVNASAQGGAIYHDNGTMTVHYSRFYGNTSVNPANGKALYQQGGFAINTITATNNWWGTNGGPATGDVATGIAPVTAPVTSPYLQLKTTAASNPICTGPTGNTSSVTAGFLINSANAAIPANQLGALSGLPVSYTVSGGTLSPSSGNISSGVHTTTFTSNGNAGNATVNPSVDGVPNNDATARVTIVVNGAAAITTQPEAAASCAGGTANFSVAASGTSLTYQWRKGTTPLVNGATGTGSTISGAATASLEISGVTAADVASDYNVVVGSSCGQATSNNVALSVSVPPVVGDPTVTQPSCSEQTATIIVNATAGETMEYSINGTDWQLSNTFTGVVPGFYDLYARLQSSPACVTEYANNHITINPPPAAPLINSVTPPQLTCAVQSGSLVVNASYDGEGALEYKLGDGDWGSSSTFSGVTPGNYTVYVRPALNPDCEVSQDDVVVNAIPDPPVVSAPTVTQPSCDPATGTIVVNATGSGSLEYRLNTGNWGNSNTFSGLAAGDYAISVRLAVDNTCVTDYDANPVVINTAPTAPTVSAPVNVTQPTCGTPTGTIVVNASGSGTLEYSIGDGWQASATFSGLTPGSYTTYARLQATPNCSGSFGPVQVNPTAIAPALLAPTVVQPSCATPLGSILVNFEEATLVVFRLNGGDWQESSFFPDLEPDNYTIEAAVSTDLTCVSAWRDNPVVLTAPTGCTVPATIDCPGNITAVAAAGTCSAAVNFAAQASGVPDPTVVYKIGNTVITSPHTFPVGVTTVTATATNSTGNDDCSFTVTVEDNQSPVMTAVNDIYLWPPDHKYQRISAANLVSSITDNCGTINKNSVVIQYVTSDEADDAPGKLDGSTTNDIRIAVNCKTVELRRERMDGGNGRVYTIHLYVEDASGNGTTATAKVHVPANVKGTPGVEDAAAYSVYSNCFNLVTGINTRPAPTEVAAERGATLIAWPNPVVHSTTIRYSLPADAAVSLELYNGMGQRLAILASGQQKSGTYQVSYDASKLSSGMYYYRLQVTDSKGRQEVINGKLVVAR